MDEFLIWLSIGINHILSIEGTDHLLFILTISLIFQLKDFKKIILLISGFTLGHTVSLLLSSLIEIKLDTILIEFLIPITIIVSAINNLISKNIKLLRLCIINGVFGLIHGLAFSSSIAALLDQKNKIIIPLLAFNLGIEISQLIVLTSYLMFTTIIIYLFKINQEKINKSISGIIAGIGLIMCYQKLSSIL